MSVFHDSFRVFVRSGLSEPIKSEIMQTIAAKLKTEQGTPRWYQHCFAYAYRAGDDEYVLGQIDKRSVDRAMCAFRPDAEIMDAIGWAVEAAKRKSDLRAMAFLGPLKYRTNERMEENIDRSLLAKTLLYLGRKEEVVGFSCQLKNNRWLVSQDVALDLIVWCAKTNQHDLGRKLFGIFAETFRPDEALKQQHVIERIGTCLGFYGIDRGKDLRWLSASETSRDYVSDPDYEAPVYAPHIAAYVDAGVQSRNRQWAEGLKGINRLFSNKAIRHFIIRALARKGDLKNLSLDIQQYLERFPGETNLELAVHAAMAGLPAAQVRLLAGSVSAPPRTMPDKPVGRDYAGELHSHLLATIVMAYENSSNALGQSHLAVAGVDSYWAGIVRFILSAGECIGTCYAGRQTDIPSMASSALKELSQAKKAESERIFELHDGIRMILPQTLFWLTQVVQKTGPDRLPWWSTELLKLRDCDVWKLHYGINESIQNYSFESVRLGQTSRYKCFQADLTAYTESLS